MSIKKIPIVTYTVDRVYLASKLNHKQSQLPTIQIGYHNLSHDEPDLGMVYWFYLLRIMIANNPMHSTGV